MITCCCKGLRTGVKENQNSFIFIAVLFLAVRLFQDIGAPAAEQAASCKSSDLRDRHSYYRGTASEMTQ